MIYGYEALVRWRHPELGRLAPDRFVPFAETCGLSTRLDAWVIFHACEEAAACKGDCYFSVNISAQWIASSKIVSLIRAALEQSGLSPSRLILEITEASACGSEDSAIKHMHQLRALGVRLALDDFGSGYSALRCLQAYPLDMLKLGHNFVAASEADVRGRLVAEGVIQLAKLLNLEVIAEGIETQGQADLMSNLGCRRGQGFLWSKAQSAPWLDVAAENPSTSKPNVAMRPSIPEPDAINKPLMLNSLPHPNTTRWVPHRKAEVVAAVQGGMITIDEVCQRYNLTLEEFSSWERAVDRARHKGLRITRTQFYRDLFEKSPKSSDEIPFAHEISNETINQNNDKFNAARTDETLSENLPIQDQHIHNLEKRFLPEQFGPIPNGSERRAVSRLALLLRVAKLVLDGSEQFCIIRDASTTGLKVKLFVPLPEHADLAIEFANGERYSVQCVWTKNETAGLQFCEPISLDHLLNYVKDTGRRRHLRLRISLDGVVHLGEKTASVVFSDISQHGAAFKTDIWLLVNELVKIETAILPAVYARVRWRNHPHYGVSFEQTFQLQELAIRISYTQRHSHVKGDDPSKSQH